MGAAVSGASSTIKQNCLQQCPVRAWKCGQPLLRGNTESLFFPWSPGQACPYLLRRGLRALEERRPRGAQPPWRSTGLEEHSRRRGGAQAWRSTATGLWGPTSQEMCPSPLPHRAGGTRPAGLPQALPSRPAGWVFAWSWGFHGTWVLLEGEEFLS